MSGAAVVSVRTTATTRSSPTRLTSMRPMRFMSFPLEIR